MPSAAPVGRDAVPIPPPAQTPPTIIHNDKGARGASAEVYLALQKSESEVLHAASRIFSAYIVANKVDDSNESAMSLSRIALTIGNSPTHVTLIDVVAPGIRVEEKGSVAGAVK